MVGEKHLLSSEVGVLLLCLLSLLVVTFAIVGLLELGYFSLQSLYLLLFFSNIRLFVFELYLINIVLLLKFFNFIRQGLPFGLILLHLAALRALSRFHRFRCLSNLKLLFILRLYYLTTFSFASAAFARHLKCFLLLDVEFLF